MTIGTIEAALPFVAEGYALDPLDRRLEWIASAVEVCHAAIERWREAEVRRALLEDIDHHLAVMGVSELGRQRMHVPLRVADLVVLVATVDAAREMVAAGRYVGKATA